MKYAYVVAYTGVVQADTIEEATQAANDAHLLLADVTIDVTEMRDDARDA